MTGKTVTAPFIDRTENIIHNPRRDNWVKIYRCIYSHTSNKLSYFHKVIIGTIQILVQLNHQRLEERGELPLLFCGFILGYGRLQSKCYCYWKYECKQFCFYSLYKIGVGKTFWTFNITTKHSLFHSLYSM